MMPNYLAMYSTEALRAELIKRQRENCLIKAAVRVKYGSAEQIPSRYLNGRKLFPMKLSECASFDKKLTLLTVYDS